MASFAALAKSAVAARRGLKVSIDTSPPHRTSGAPSPGSQRSKAVRRLGDDDLDFDDDGRCRRCERSGGGRSGGKGGARDAVLSFCDLWSGGPDDGRVPGAGVGVDAARPRPSRSRLAATYTLRL